ncbi:hypothetical protein LTR08_009271 [Meristemomyces frigidus]|nr:hypothetical protein LTR08_009271 [Meristemomyces frigidus]
MPAQAPDANARDHSDTEPMTRHAQDSSDSDIDELDPLKTDQGRYTDDARRPLRSSPANEKTTRNASLTRQPLRWLDTQRSRGGWLRWCIPSRFCCILVGIFFTTLFLLLSVGGLWVYNSGGVPEDGQSEPWYPAPRGGTVRLWEKSYARAAELVGQMTLVEKVNVTTGTGWKMDMCVGQTGAVERLGFPSLCLQDGPLGLRFADNATAFPAGITVGATWNKDLMYERGRAHGYEARMKGIHILLGPSMGPLGRLPAGGRTWEGFGADPVLQGIAAAQTIRGIQSSGVIATAKHYVANEQEHYRQPWEWGTPNAISSNIDDRTMHEVYAWPFAESVRAGVGSVMCSYNQLNNSYACQNSKLLNGILKDELGFQGFVQSDWLAQRSGVASALAGLDATLPGDGLLWQDGKSLWGKELTIAVLNGSVPMERLNDMVLRVVAAWYQLGQDNEERWPKGAGPNFSSWTNDEVGLLHPGSPGCDEKGTVNHFVPVRQTEEGGDHNELARRVAREGIVLVKNTNNTLPLTRNGTGLKTHRTQTGKARVGIFGESAFPNPNGANACADRRCNVGALASGWGSGAVELPYLVTPAEALHANFDDQTVQVTDWKTNAVEHVDGTAAAQDVCLVFITSDAGEGYISWEGVNGDRNDLNPQKGGDALVRDVAANCGGRDEQGVPVSDTIVVLHTVGPTILDKWIDMPGVKAVLIAHLPGQESGNALADVLFGDHSPSGHLPYTIAKREQDYGPHSGILRHAKTLVPQQDFTEGLLIDYRHFSAYNITPRYPFGHGLSYTSFQLSGLFVHPLNTIRTPEPLARLPASAKPPTLDPAIPDPRTALWPKGLRKVPKYIYPWLDSLSEVRQGGRYEYPVGYEDTHPPSPAGGGEGGNPDLYTEAVEVRATLSNTGLVGGDAVVQMYISFPANVTDSLNRTVAFPVRVLRNWAKVRVGTSNEAKRREVKMVLTRKDLSFWDGGRGNWVVPGGEFEVGVGFSERDLPLRSSFLVRERASSYIGAVQDPDHSFLHERHTTAHHPKHRRQLTLQLDLLSPAVYLPVLVLLALLAHQFTQFNLPGLFHTAPPPQPSCPAYPAANPFVQDLYCRAPTHTPSTHRSPHSMALAAAAERVAAEFEFDDAHINRAVHEFIREMDEGLAQQGATMSQIPTYVTAVPNGTEKGLYMAVDLGGTNFRVCSIQLHGNSTFSLTQSKVKIPHELMTAKTSHELFAFLAKQIEAFLKAHHYEHYACHMENRRPRSTRGFFSSSSDTEAVEIFSLGFTFSFPVQQSGINKGNLIRWTKGFDIADTIGKDVCALLQTEIDALGLPVRVAALVNDTVGTLMARSYSSPGKTGTLLGAIFGTGTNGAYVEKLARITKLSAMGASAGDVDDSTGEMIVNTEWGSFDNHLSVLPITPYDASLDAESNNPGIQMFEKRVSGMFLGEILRRAILDLVHDKAVPLFSDEHSNQNDVHSTTNIHDQSALYRQWGLDTSFLSIAAGDASKGLKATRQTLDKEYGVSAASAEDAEAVRLIAAAVGKRAARLSAVAIAAVILSTGKLDAPRDIATTGEAQGVEDDDAIDIGVDGSLVEFYPLFEEYIREALRAVRGIGAAGERRVRIGIAKDGSGVGAALIALVADRAGSGGKGVPSPTSSSASTGGGQGAAGFLQSVMASVNRSLRLRV